MSRSILSPYQATLFVRRSARDAVIAAARELAVGDAAVLRGTSDEGNVLQVRLTFAASTATEAERLIRRAFGSLDSVLAITDIELRLPGPERRRVYEERVIGGGSDGPPGGGGESHR
ncbi:MAG TPA: hypothetical protein VMA36_02040 [Candidatus Limnocylindria bacterium]|jgi:hypothetical protein|nr:hypothetical protein [Candidatus Limnocylindria bacterium]